VEKPIWLRNDPAKTDKPWVLNMPAWDPVALFQGELASAAGLEGPARELCLQTLIRRVTFAYEGEPVDLNCWVEAVCIAPNFNKEKDSETLRGVMAKASKAAWDRFKASHKFRFDINASIKAGKIKSVLSPIYRLQQMANRFPELDGILIE